MRSRVPCRIDERVSILLLCDASRSLCPPRVGCKEGRSGSVRGGPANGVDDDDLEWFAAGFEAQAELLLQRGEDRRTIVRWWTCAWSRRDRAACPLKIEVERTGEPGAIHDRASRHRLQRIGEVLHGERPRSDEAPRG